MAAEVPQENRYEYESPFSTAFTAGASVPNGLSDVHVAVVAPIIVFSKVDGTVVDTGGGLTWGSFELESGKHFLQEVKGPNSIGFGPLTLVGEQTNGGPKNKKV